MTLCAGRRHTGAEPDYSGHRRLILLLLVGAWLVPNLPSVEASGTAFVKLGRVSHSAWSVVPSPNLNVRRGVLTSVTCTSSTACTAVGYTSTYAPAIVGLNSVPLAERWNGKKWSTQPTPDPGDGKGAALLALSCPSTTACIAVGSYVNAHTGNDQILAEDWNGKAWETQSITDPSGGSGSVLSGVSCTAPDACTAVGHYSQISSNYSTQVVALAEHWNGTLWTVQPTPHIAGAGSIVLGDISCSRATVCTAVGNYVNTAGVEVTLSERWNGTAWAILTSPSPAGASASALWGITCSSGRACVSVGNYRNHAGAYNALAEYLNGIRWQIQPSAEVIGSRHAVLSKVACSTRFACTAVGDYLNRDGTLVTLAEHWNGGKWAIQPTPNPASANASALADISCWSPTACASVGNYQNRTGAHRSLEERWNGSKWTIDPTRDRPGGVPDELNGVFCSASTAC